MGENKYSKGKIYKIVDKGYNKTYIGSTVQTLSNRMSQHRTDYQDHRSGTRRVYTSSYVLFDEYGVENCKIELIELFPCGSKMELHKREGHHIKNSECINKFVPGRTKAEYRDDKREIINQKATTRYHDNIDEERKRNLLNYEKHKEARINKQKMYYQSHKDIIKEQHSRKITCDVCGSCICSAEKRRHERTKRHQDKLKEKKQPRC
jgi:hypothetical protein